LQEEKPDAQPTDSQAAEPQAVEIDENQNQPPIEIKSISPDQQQQSDLDEQPSEFTQTTSENPNI
jgi:uncharacterized protein YlxW (UPF0749 family)